MVTSPWRKSSRSGGHTGNCVEVRGAWRKSSRSGGNTGNCVEARLDDCSPQIRDSKLGDASPILTVTPADYTALLAILK